MNLVDITLSEISQSQEDKYLHEVLRVVRITDTDRMVMAREWREEEVGSYCLMGLEFQLYKMPRVLEVAVQHYECIRYHCIVHLKMVKVVTFFVMSILLQLKKMGEAGRSGSRL